MLQQLDFQTITAYFEQYGILFFFLVIFLEHLSLPGLPAGIVMPSAGYLMSQAGVPFWQILIISVAAGLAGSLVLYAIGYFLGKPLLQWIKRKNKKIREVFEKAQDYVENNSSKALFISRLTPILRTNVSLVGGTLKINLAAFALYSALGILVWNFVTIYAGYAFGHLFLHP